jgi:hypothetical protein
VSVAVNTTWVLVALISASAASVHGQQASCAASPQVAAEFAPHLADSTKLFRGQFSPDGTELYYFKKVTLGQEDYRIFVSRLHNGAWSPPERTLIAGEEVSELYPAVSPDGKRLVFSSYQAVPGDTSAHPNAHLYVAERRGSGWGMPVLQRAASRIGWYHSGPVVQRDNSLHFMITSPDWRTAITMRSEWNGTEYGPAVPYAEAERWRDWQQDRMRVWGAQSTRHDSVMLVLVSERMPGGRSGPADIYASFRRGDGWTDPRPLGAGVNTPGAAENFAFFTPDGCELVFTRGFSRFYHVSFDAALTAARP